jgi:hypothetical protein
MMPAKPTSPVVMGIVTALVLMAFVGIVVWMITSSDRPVFGQ